MGGWVDGWVAGLAGNIAISAQLKLELWLSLAILKVTADHSADTFEKAPVKTYTY